MPLHVPDEVLHEAVEAYRKAGGNRSEAARLLNLPRKTYVDRLEMAVARFKLTLGKIADGRVDYVQAKRMPLPKAGAVKRYVLTSAQNNTYPHKEGLRNILAYVAWLDALPNASCEFIVGTYSYALDAYGQKAVKLGTFDPARQSEDLWYAPELVPYIRDESLQLAPGLVWCGEMNILPTAQNPLTGLESYNGRNSNIVPHATIALESVASLPDEATKFNYATGTITLRNYIQKRAGILAERRHCYGGLLVEVDSGGNWWVRQLHVGDGGVVYDIGPSGYRSVRVQSGRVEAIRANAKPDRTFVEAINWGDVHTAEMELWVRELAWGRGGFLDQLAARRQFFHDVLSMRSRSHHEVRDFHKSFEKYVNGEDSVRDEVELTADFLHEASRPWCESIVVRSNHDRHLDRWLNEADPRTDPANALYWSELQTRKLRAITEGDRGFNTLEWALRNASHGVPANMRFLGEDESFVICKDAHGGIECGLHGDLGPNGSRGSTRALMKLGRPTNKAHDHTATIRGPVYSAGACSLSFPYMRGPHAHSISHIVTFVNGARQIVTFWSGRARA